MSAPTALMRGGLTSMELAADGGVWQAPSWDEIVRDHSARVFRLAYRLTGNRHEAEDLTQEVFVRVFRSLDTFRPGTFEGWLHRITTNLFLDQARRRRRIKFESLPENAADRLMGSMPAPDLSLADQIFDDDIEVALRELKPEFRVAVVLCDVEGLSYEEISEILESRSGRSGPASTAAARSCARPSAPRTHGHPPPLWRCAGRKARGQQTVSRPALQGVRADRRGAEPVGSSSRPRPRPFVRGMPARDRRDPRGEAPGQQPRAGGRVLRPARGRVVPVADSGHAYGSRQVGPAPQGLLQRRSIPRRSSRLPTSSALRRYPRRQPSTRR